MKELRFVALPFSVGCVSQSSVAVIENRTKRAMQAAETAAATTVTLQGGEDGEQSFVKRRTASFSGTALSFSRPNVAAGFHRLIRGFRSLSQQFLVYREEDDDDDEEMEMVIGFPTDVQHVGHIGWNGFDGMAGASAMTKSWEKAAAPEFLSLPSCS